MIYFICRRWLISKDTQFLNGIKKLNIAIILFTELNPDNRNFEFKQFIDWL